MPSALLPPPLARFYCPVCGAELHRRRISRTRRTRAQIAARVAVPVVARERILATPWECPLGIEEHRTDFPRTRHRGGEVAWCLEHIERRRREFLPPGDPDRAPWTFQAALP
jgi:hypothetical protein